MTIQQITSWRDDYFSKNIDCCIVIKHETFTSVKMLIDRTIKMLQANTGNITYLPYYNRVVKVINYLSKFR